MQHVEKKENKQIVLLALFDGTNILGEFVELKPDNSVSLARVYVLTMESIPGQVNGPGGPQFVFTDVMLSRRPLFTKHDPGMVFTYDSRLIVGRLSDTKEIKEMYQAYVDQEKYKHIKI